MPRPVPASRRVPPPPAPRFPLRDSGLSRELRRFSHETGQDQRCRWEVTVGWGSAEPWRQPGSQGWGACAPRCEHLGLLCSPQLRHRRTQRCPPVGGGAVAGPGHTPQPLRAVTATWRGQGMQGLWVPNPLPHLGHLSFPGHPEWELGTGGLGTPAPTLRPLSELVT